MTMKLGELAFARSGDKGCHANIGVIARSPEQYPILERLLTSDCVLDYFRPLGVSKVDRYDLPNLHAFNFILHGVLGEGGSRSLRVDAQGKTLGQALMLMDLVQGDTP